MKTPIDFLRALAARLGLNTDRNMPRHHEARRFINLGGELRNESRIQEILKKTPTEDQAAMRRLLGLSAIFLAVSLNHSGEASTTNPHPRATGAVSTTARARGNGGQAGAVIVSLPRSTTAGQFRRGASEVVPQRVIGSRVLRSTPSTSARDSNGREAAGGLHDSRDRSRATFSGPRVRNPGMRGTFGENLVVDCCARRAGGTKTLRAYYTQASWYGEECAGDEMAFGGKFDPNAMTCASWFHDRNTRLRVSAGGRSVIVRVTDRGPHMRLVKGGRGIDLSRAAFAKLAPNSDGLVDVKVEVL